MIERAWLEKFYAECGREVSLAYNVLNTTNNWAVGLGAAVLATALINGGVEVRGGVPRLLYPNYLHWVYAIVAWVIMLRFFARSCLAYTNMERWNTLIFATAKVLSLPSDDSNAQILQRNLAKKIEAYYFNWKAPIRLHKLVWRTAKLLYLWFMVGLVGLISWGAVELHKNTRYWITILALIAATGFELIILVRWFGLQYYLPEMDPEPTPGRLWGVDPEAPEQPSAVSDTDAPMD